MEYGSSAPSDCAEKFKKTILCRYYPRCGKGKDCAFAHADQELRARPDFTKTRMCAGYHDGRCKLPSAKCNFAHGLHELRSVDGSGRMQAMEDEHCYDPGVVTQKWNASQQEHHYPLHLKKATHETEASRRALQEAFSVGLRGELTKTRMCEGFYDGRCRLPAERCPHAHGLHELRSTVGGMRAIEAADALRNSVEECADPPRWSGPPPSTRSQRQQWPRSSSSSAASTASEISTPANYAATSASTAESSSPGGQAAANNAGAAVQPLVAKWLNTIRTLTTTTVPNEQKNQLPSAEECRLALLKAMPEYYED